MRKRLLGSIAALAAGAGAAWGQPPVEPGTPPLPPSLTAPLGPAAPQPPVGGPPVFGGLPQYAIPGNAGFAPPAVIMPPGNYGPPGDPLGLGPTAGFGPPPAPMYPMPGPPGAQTWQPAPDMPATDLNYGTAPHYWFNGEYLVWFNDAMRLKAPLLTTSAPTDGGVIGAPSTTVLVGNKHLGYGGINGLRLSGGFFGDADRRFGFEWSVFVLERAANTQVFGDVGNFALSGIPTLARPFIDSTTGTQSAVVLSGPDFGAARVNVATTNQAWGIDALGVWNLFRTEPGCKAATSVDFLAGYRFIEIKEELFVQSRTLLDPTVALPVFQTGPFGVITQSPAVAAPARAPFGGVTIGGLAGLEIRDRFRALNKFNGGVVGLRGEVRYGMWTVSSYTKVAVGNMHERIEVFGGGSFYDPTGRSGVTRTTQGAFDLRVGGGAGSAIGGVLANTNNLGIFLKDHVDVIPEVGLNVGLALTRSSTIYLGGTLIYFPNVARPGDLINPVVNSSAIPFSANYGNPNAVQTPTLRIVDSHYWLGGVNVGLQIRY
jgi:hypothetical protein